MREERKEGRSQTKSLELEAAPLYLEEVSGKPAVVFFSSKKQIALCFALTQAIATVLGSKIVHGGRSGKRGRGGGNKRWGSSFGGSRGGGWQELLRLDTELRGREGRQMFPPTRASAAQPTRSQSPVVL